MHLNLGNPEVTLDTNILDIKIPPQMEKNVSTGMPHVDFLCAGDGMTPSTVLFLTGIAGAGKTTLGLQLADSVFGQPDCFGMYNCGEESLFQISKVVKRLDLKNGFNPSYEDDVDELIKRCDLQRARHPDKQFFLFQDSLQTLDMKMEGRKGRPLGEEAMAVECLKKLTAWAKSTFSIVVAIGQVTKGGVFAGKNALKHILDCHLHLSIDTDKKSETYGQRVAEMQKNRFGPAGLYYPFQLGDKGVKFLDDQDFGMAEGA